MTYIQLIVATWFALTPIGGYGQNTIPIELINIAECESHTQQFYDDGTLVTNPESGAMGIYQELPFHQKTADKMNLDLKTAEGNVAYAVWLFKKYGTSPWLASKSCWNKTELALNSP